MAAGQKTFTETNTEDEAGRRLPQSHSPSACCLKSKMHLRNASLPFPLQFPFCIPRLLCPLQINKFRPSEIDLSCRQAGRDGAGSEQLCLQPPCQDNTQLVPTSVRKQEKHSGERSKGCINTAGSSPLSAPDSERRSGKQKPRASPASGPKATTPDLSRSHSAPLSSAQHQQNCSRPSPRGMQHGRASKAPSPAPSVGYRSTQTPSAGIYPWLSAGFVELKPRTATSAITGKQTPLYWLQESKSRKEQDYREAL